MGKNLIIHESSKEISFDYSILKVPNTLEKMAFAMINMKNLRLMLPLRF